MKIFVAGSINNINAIKELMKSIKENGHNVVHDWTDQFDERRKQEFCLKDIEGLKNCDVLVACMEDCRTSCRGTLIEIGVALALDKKVVVIGEIDSIYMSHPNVTMFPSMNCYYFMNNCDNILKTYCNKQVIE